MLDFVEITENSTTPKYKQLADAMEMYIANGNMEINEKIPSVKTLSDKFNLSRETVFKSLNILSEKGILVSSNRRGYFVAKTEIDLHYRVFFMMDKMTPFKEDIYNGLRKSLGDKAEIDIYFHHGNVKVFETLIDQNLPSYSFFVIITFLNGNVSNILNRIPNGKLILLDKQESKLAIEHSQIYQDFESDVYQFLLEALEKIKNYERIILVAPNSAPHREPIIKGFQRFCSETRTNNYTIDHNEIDTIESHAVYLLIGAKDDDLVKIIKHCKKNNLILGKDLGIISYNETQMKEILEGGITVISTNFEYMGKRTAEIILSKELVHEKNPSKIIIRKSL